MDANEVEQRRGDLSRFLVNEVGAARFVGGAENRRLKESAKSLRFGRRLLTKFGLGRPAPSQINQQESMTEELQISRELIKRGIVNGIDDVAVDTRLGVRSDECMLPPSLQDLLREAEEEVGHEVTFLNWMTDHATDAQLTKVWQWHDEYLTSLDNDPDFQERVTTLKAAYRQGLEDAIAEGTLHPNMAIGKSRIASAYVTHGSPFSPLLAYSHAYVDANTIQVRKDVTDATLYHEMTHLLTDVSAFELEGVADLIAGEIYNRSNSEQAPIDPRRSIYADQIAAFDALGRMAEGRVGLYELSHAFAAPDMSTCAAQLAIYFDKAIGLPLTFPFLNSSLEQVERLATTHDGGVARGVAQKMMRIQAEFLAAMMLDGEGNKIARTAQALLERMVSDDIRSIYHATVIADGLKLLAQADALQRSRRDEV